MILKRLILAFVASLQFLALTGRDVDSLAIYRLQERLEFLCDSVQSGRATGTSGAVRTAYYLQNEFNAAGFETRVRHFAAGSKIGHNVIAVRRSPSLNSRWIIVMAYFDGLGCKNGVLYPGADSNASGVAALLELASVQTPFNLMLVGLDAHNEGCLGAENLWNFLRESGIRPDRVRMAANLDIIGTRLCPVNKGWKDFLIVLGGARYEDSLSACNSGLELRLYFDYYGSRAFTDMFYRRVSDHCALLSKGIPCVMFTSGITMTTNKPSDAVSTIDLDLLSRRTELISRWISNLK